MNARYLAQADISPRIVITALFIFALTIMPVRAQIDHSISNWDDGLLDTTLRDVHIDRHGIEAAWGDMGKKYLVRANLYVGARSDSDWADFRFNKQITTGKDLLDAFVLAFPAYTYTQDKTTGVIWIHQKRSNYEDILREKIRVTHSICSLPVFDGIIVPLCGHDPLWLGEGRKARQSFNYVIDLRADIYSVKDIINLCCVANLVKSFEFLPMGVGSNSVPKHVVIPCTLRDDNPFDPPRENAVRYFKLKMGLPTNGMPTPRDIATALSDLNPEKRASCQAYLEATLYNYKPGDIIGKCGSPECAVWAALGEEAVVFRGINDPHFLIENAAPGFTTNLMQIKDPCLALITSLELAREEQGTNYSHLDRIIANHKFTDKEVSSIKPDIYRLARESSSVVDKLRSMKLDISEFSPKALDELQNTNLFVFEPAEQR